MQRIRPMLTRFSAVVFITAGSAAPLFAQSGSPVVDVSAPRTATKSEPAFVPLIPRDLGKYVAGNQQPRDDAPLATLAPPIIRQAAWANTSNGIQLSAAQPEPGLTPKTADTGSAGKAAAEKAGPVQYQTFPALTRPMSAPCWRWFGYGAVGGTDVPQPLIPLPPPSAAPQQIRSSDGKDSTKSGLDAREDSTDLRGQSPMPLPAQQVAPKLQPVTAIRRPSATIAEATVRRQQVATAGFNSALDSASVGSFVQTNFVPLESAKPVAAPRPIETTHEASPKTGGTTWTELIRSKISEKCEGKISGIELTVRGHCDLGLILTVSQSADAAWVANKIAEIPELAAYRIQYEIHIRP